VSERRGITRRGFWGRLVGGGAAVALAPADPPPARGVAAVIVHCPQCGWQPSCPSGLTAAGPAHTFVPPRDRQDEVWVDCVNCQQRYRARFWVEV